jgi:nucleoside-diphosphate kinase
VRRPSWGKAEADTIRGDYAVSIGRNLIHASDSPENAVAEINLFFAPSDLLDWRRTTDPWILEE